ncbi:hypothetical protein ACH5RR_003342 [Cinchona calisaya]|uniref:Uncharacterized protein n=1 Tax=Cinchona calisaya TaxID=153742 RepID=A0ABD3AUK2_9GENT
MTRQGWTLYGTHIQHEILSLVRESYANATKGEDRLVTVRGVQVLYPMEYISAILGTPRVEQDEYRQYMLTILLSLDFSCGEKIPWAMTVGELSRPKTFHRRFLPLRASIHHQCHRDTRCLFLPSLITTLYRKASLQVDKSLEETVAPRVPSEGSNCGLCSESMRSITGQAMQRATMRHLNLDTMPFPLIVPTSGFGFSDSGEARPSGAFGRPGTDDVATKTDILRA